MMEQAYAMVQTKTARQAIHITLMATDRAQVLADPLRLRQVLINLMSNAVKYNRPGGKVQVSCQEDGLCWPFVVTDNAQGITEAQKAHVFEPFNRLDQMGSAVPGTGIGLSITLKLVEAMGGQIGLESQAG